MRLQIWKKRNSFVFQTELNLKINMRKKDKLEGDFYGSEKGKAFYNLQKINEAVGGSLDSMNSAKELLNPFKFTPKGPSKLKQKLNKKTGEIELWKD